MRALEPFIWIAWDILAVLIVAYHVHKCAYRGFVATLVRALVYVGAAFAAYRLYIHVADWLYDNVVETAVLHALTRNFNQMLPYGGSGGKGIMEAIPMSLKLLLLANRADVSAVTLSGDAPELAANILGAFLEPPLMSLLRTSTFLFIFGAASFAMKRLARIFAGLNRVPVIGWLNTLLGGILGVLIGAVTLLISALILRFSVTTSAESWWWLNGEVMDATYIWRVFWM